MSADGKRAMSGSGDSALKVWDLNIERERLILSGHSANAIACALSMDGKRAVSGSTDGTIRVWDVDSGREQFIHL